MNRGKLVDREREEESNESLNTGLERREAFEEEGRGEVGESETSDGVGVSFEMGERDEGGEDLSCRGVKPRGRKGDER